MAKIDELDKLLLNTGLTEEDWQAFAGIYAVQLKPTFQERREQINEEIRHSYGHSISNIFRSWWEPDYAEILEATANKLKINVKEHHSIVEIEDKIMIEVIELTKEQIVKEKGMDAWNEIERQVDQEIQKLIAAGTLPHDELENLKNLKSTGLMALLLAGRLAGFSLYIVAMQSFFAVSRLLGLSIGVAVAGPIIGRTLGMLLGPAGWLLSGIWLVYDLGNTNWKKTIPSIVMTIALRRKLGIA